MILIIEPKLWTKLSEITTVIAIPQDRLWEQVLRHVLKVLSNIINQFFVIEIALMGLKLSPSHRLITGTASNFDEGTVNS